MSETAAAPAPEHVKESPPEQKAAANGTGGGKAKCAYPSTAQMVKAAIKSLKGRGGSSLQAIKKYIASTYKIDAKKHATLIRKYIRGAVASGKLLQIKGTGASGSFKLPGNDKKVAAKSQKAPRPQKRTPAKNPKKAK